MLGSNDAMYQGKLLIGQEVIDYPHKYLNMPFRKYVTSQSKREYEPDFVPTRGESNDYTPDDGVYLQPSPTNQEKVPPCVALSITTTDQETYDRVPVRGGSVNKRGKAKGNNNPQKNVTRDSGDHYDFPSKVVRHV